jgi:hypothetical protein
LRSGWTIITQNQRSVRKNKDPDLEDIIEAALKARALAPEADLEERMDDYYTESEVSKKKQGYRSGGQQ